MPNGASTLQKVLWSRIGIERLRVSEPDPPH